MLPHTKIERRSTNHLELSVIPAPNVYFRLTPAPPLWNKTARAPSTFCPWEEVLGQGGYFSNCFSVREDEPVLQVLSRYYCRRVPAEASWSDTRLRMNLNKYLSSLIAGSSHSEHQTDTVASAYLLRRIRSTNKVRFNGINLCNVKQCPEGGASISSWQQKGHNSAMKKNWRKRLFYTVK